jgi:hypothetical protein
MSTQGALIQQINNTFKQSRIPVEIKMKRNFKDIQKPKLNGLTELLIV